MSKFGFEYKNNQSNLWICEFWFQVWTINLSFPECWRLHDIGVEKCLISWTSSLQSWSDPLNNRRLSVLLNRNWISFKIRVWVTKRKWSDRELLTGRHLPPVDTSDTLPVRLISGRNVSFPSVSPGFNRYRISGHFDDFWGQISS